VPVTFNGGSVSNAVTAISNAAKGGAIELVLYKKVGIGSGEGSGNPWLQELPDPITRATWDNYVIISPAMARSLLNIDLSNNSQVDAYEVHPAKEVLKITISGKDLFLFHFL
jgi:molybdopterin-containing oxidoreductase family iron-sulfur binding subunit